MHIVLIHVAKNTLPPRAAARLQDHELTVITERGRAQEYGPAVTIMEIASVRDISLVTDTFLHILRSRGIDRIVMPFELGQSVAGFLRSSFGIPGMGFETANAFSNKYVMKQRYVAAGIPTAPCAIAAGPHLIAQVAERIGWPVVVKPMLGGGSMDVHALAGPADLERLMVAPETSAFRALTVPLVVEPFVDVLVEYHCDGVVVDGEVVFAAPSQYLAPLLDCPEGMNGSFFLVDESAERDTILEQHRAAVRELGMRDGVTHMEFFGTVDGILAGEIACRPAGGGIPEAIRLAYNVDIWDAMVSTMLGEPVELAARTTEGVLVNYHLPVRPGRIDGLSSPEELASAPYVTKVDMLKAPGDVVPQNYNSSYTTGLVFLNVPTTEQVGAAVAGVLDRFVLDVENIVDAAPAQ